MSSSVMQSRQFVEDTFEGSLPAFLAAFTKDRALAYDSLRPREPENNGAVLGNIFQM